MLVLASEWQTTLILRLTHYITQVIIILGSDSTNIWAPTMSHAGEKRGLWRQEREKESWLQRPGPTADDIINEVFCLEERDVESASRW